MKERLNDASYRWLNVPRWYLWDGGFLLFGQAQGVVPAHSHHAIQIVISLDQPVAVCGHHENWSRGCGIVVRPDVVHSFDCSGAFGAMLFVDPESSEGVWLRTLLTQNITMVPDARLASSVSELRTFAEQPFAGLEVAALVRHCVHALSPGPPPMRRLDPRVTTVLNRIQASDDLRVSLSAAAAMAFLSPSRFAHLFRQQVGLPFSRYMLWRKLTRAMLVIGSERTIADAAHAADFADAAHLTADVLSNRRHGAVGSDAWRIFSNHLTVQRVRLGASNRYAPESWPSRATSRHGTSFDGSLRKAASPGTCPGPKE